MLIFNSIYFIIFMGLFIFSKRKQKNVYIIIVIILYFLSFFRWGVGTDWENYYLLFKTKSLSEMYQVNEIGFKLLNLFVGKITSSYTIMLWVLATILFLFKYTTIWSLSYYPMIALLLSFSYYRGDIYFIRQHIAAAICLFALKYYLNNKLKKFVLVVILAVLIHSSAIVFLLILALKNKNVLSRSFYLKALIIALIFIPMMKEIMLFLGEKLMFLGVYGYKIKRYIEAGHALFGANVNNIIVHYASAISNKIFITLFLGINLKKMTIKDRELYNIYYTGTIIYILLVGVSSQILRVNIYFEIVSVILLSNYVRYIKNKTNKIIYLIFISVYAYLKLISGLGSQLAGVYLPYISIFN